MVYSLLKGLIIRFNTSKSAIDISISPSLTWNMATEAASYTLHVLTSSSQTNPTGAISTGYCVLRGGCFNYIASNCMPG